ncbi:carbon monoxide dehydrogenase subunit G [Xanthobacter dioxanivorans]|uniref:Carbon monoxide dehydrogenase subunit G n=1 Tax=Xanthobacter dioxanivorans TaxID=2528964 RepID=A0A974SIC1_9HYPH|nr:carbon monoxide dehydrogenase subunit G [Xanthobacter dioxanivorans]QRG06024.1 carbon monoxide dehydrogenase subunit G [Xanthobacter dioxanivorans]
MELTGEYRISAPRETVWRAILDPDMLRRCIPGCKELERTGDNAYAAKVQVKVGPVSATFSGSVELTDMEAPAGCRIVGQGNGGIAGFAKGEAKVSLAEDGADTILTYVADAQIGGKLASLGGRLVQATAKKLSDQFFTAFAEALNAPAEAGPETSGTA